jgi:DNA-binding transcriptional MocR family regulator
VTVAQPPGPARFAANRPGRRLGPVASAGTLHGLGSDVIVFGGGLPDPTTHPAEVLGGHLADVLRDEPGPALTYETSLGTPALRRAVAEYLTRRDGASYGEDQVCITGGSSGAISLAALSFLNPGDTVLVEEITYPQALKAFGQLGVGVVPCPVDGSGLLVDELEQTLKARRAAGAGARAIYFGANFGIPLNGWLPLERREALVRLAQEHDVLLLQDDTYGAIRFVDIIPPSLVAMAPDFAVELGSFSKTIAPGLRLGWAASSAPMAEVMGATRTDLGASPLLQRAVARYLLSGQFDMHVAEVCGHYRRKRDAVAGALTEACGDAAEWRLPDGGFCIWMTLAEGTADQLAAAGRRHGVAFLPQSYFSATGSDGPRLRLAYGEGAVPDLLEGARRLGAAVHDRRDTT